MKKKMNEKKKVQGSWNGLLPILVLGHDTGDCIMTQQGWVREGAIRPSGCMVRVRSRADTRPARLCDIAGLGVGVSGSVRARGLVTVASRYKILYSDRGVALVQRHGLQYYAQRPAIRRRSAVTRRVARAAWASVS